MFLVVLWFIFAVPGCALQQYGVGGCRALLCTAVYLRRSLRGPVEHNRFACSYIITWHIQANLRIELRKRCDRRLFCQSVSQFESTQRRCLTSCSLVLARTASQRSYDSSSRMQTRWSTMPLAKQHPRLEHCSTGTSSAATQDTGRPQQHG